jgi:aminoglycoside 3'-phosphotransferase II
MTSSFDKVVFIQNLPTTIHKIVEGATVIPITIGRSSDDVYRIETNETYYLKIGVALDSEYEHLQWLDGKLPVPQVIDFEVRNGKQYMLTSEIKGKMLSNLDLPIVQCLELYAEGAHMWHSLPVEDCPFDQTRKTQIETARQNLEAQQINSANFDSRYFGKSEHELFEDLLNAIPPSDEDPVVTHGDYCLPNILIDPKTAKITGFVDVGTMGVSDRHLDLVLASRSIQYNMGGKYIDHFYELYGIEYDAVKYHFYCILNEFI